jgi:hypothetical protein
MGKHSNNLIKELLAQQEEEDLASNDDLHNCKPIPGGIDPATVPLPTANTVWSGFAGLPVCRLSYAMACGRLGPLSFPAVVSKAYYPRTTNMVFRTGKFVVTGARTIELGILACTKLVHSMSMALHKRYRVMNLCLVNLVKSINFGNE